MSRPGAPGWDHPARHTLTQGTLRRLREAADQMKAIARKVAPSRTVDVLKDDPRDNWILECAAQAKSDYLVTGDRGRLSLGSFEDIPIVKVADFLEIVSRQGEGRGPLMSARKRKAAFVVPPST